MIFHKIKAYELELSYVSVHFYWYKDFCFVWVKYGKWATIFTTHDLDNN